MLAAAKRDVVDGFLEMLKAAGLLAVVVDVDAFALENSYTANYGTEENVALIDIGASKMNINVLQRGTSVLARDIGMGGRQLTEQIQGKFGISVEEAEAIKTGVVSADDRINELERIFAGTCSQWAMEIKRALDFYYSNNPDEPITKMALSGGGARIKGLDEYLQHETGIDVEIFNPFAKITADAKIDADYLQTVAPEMALCVGLATRPVEV
jgi:type IV pilus assembly protein PilM